MGYFNFRKNLTTESVEDFLARGGKIQKVSVGSSSKKRKPRIDAQKLLEGCRTESDVKSVLSFLAANGIVVGQKK